MRLGSFLGLPLLLLAAAFACADDAEELVRRAETRLSRGERAGVHRLFQQALDANPRCVRALAWLAEHEFRGIEYRTRFLLTGRPLDIPVAREVLASLARDLAAPPEELYLAVEGATLYPTEPEAESFGPLMPWERSLKTFAWTPPAGPLRGEAFDTGAHCHKDILGAIAQRFAEDGVTDPVCWARLAVLFQQLSEPGAADEAFRHANPTTSDEWIDVAECALHLVEDRATWWDRYGTQVLNAIRCLACGSEPAPNPCSILAAARPVPASRRDLIGLAALAEAQALCLPLVEHGDPFGEALSATCSTLSEEEALSRLEREKDPACVCLYARALMSVDRAEEGVKRLEALVTSSPDSLVGWSLLHWYAIRSGKRAEAAVARRGLIQTCLQATRGAVRRRWEVARDLDLVSTGDDQALARLLSCGTAEPGVVAGLAEIEGTREARIAMLDALVEACGRSFDERSVASVLRLAIRLDRVEAAFALTRRMTQFSTDVRYRFWTVDGYGYQDWELHGAVSFLRCCAAEVPLSEAQDLLLRSFVEQIRGHVRRWMLAQLAMDDRFGALPGAPYVVSLFREEFYDAEVAAGLRRSAYNRGFRAPHLLRRMAFDGAPVLEELRRLDPVGARLIEARSSGIEAVQVLLEDVELPEEHRRFAEWALRSLPRCEAEAPQEARSPGEAARRLMTVLQADPRAAIDLSRWHGHGYRWGSLGDILKAASPPHSIAPR